MEHLGLGPMTADKRQSIKVGAFMGIGIAVLVMVPAVYRLSTEPLQWADAALVAVGVGLIAFHLVRLVRLNRAPAAAEEPDA